MTAGNAWKKMRFPLGIGIAALAGIAVTFTALTDVPEPYNHPRTVHQVRYIAHDTMACTLPEDCFWAGRLSRAERAMRDEENGDDESMIAFMGNGRGWPIQRGSRVYLLTENDPFDGVAYVLIESGAREGEKMYLARSAFYNLNPAAPPSAPRLATRKPQGSGTRNQE